MQKANGDEDYIPQNHDHNSPVPCGAGAEFVLL